MTRRKRVYGRARHTVPVQVYVSESEHAELQALSERRGVTIATIVRAWIKRATAAERGRSRAPAAEDPRQLRIEAS